MKIGGIAMPARKERFTVYKVENLTYIDLSPTLKKGTNYAYLRQSLSPLKSLVAVIESATKSLN